MSETVIIRIVEIEEGLRGPTRLGKRNRIVER